MLNEHTLDQLRALRLDGMVHALEDQASSTAAAELPFDDRLTLLVQREIAWRDEFLAQHCADLGIRLETRPGPTVLALLDVAASEDVDVIALGWHQDLAPERAVVVREVLQRARRPVALIPRGQPRPR